MTEFYEPMLYMSTPEHPNTMGVEVRLKEDVDGALLEAVVEELRCRFPYFYVQVNAQGENLHTENNPLPMVVRKGWAPISFNAKESNFHLASWKYEGKRLAFEISHSLTDGAGVLPYIKSAMFLYLSRKTGVNFDATGFRLPGQEIPESETGNPFAHLDIDKATPPLYTKPPVEDFYRLNQGEAHPRLFYICLDETQLMQYCKDYDGSPNAFLSVMLARAARHYDPKNEKPITISVAIDHKAMLGNHDNYRLFANVLELEFPKERSLDNLMKACTITRGQMMVQASFENSLWAMKMRKATYARLDQAPLSMKLGMIAKSAGRTRWSMSLSYVNSRSFGPLDPYIDSVFVLAEPGVSDLICEISCINHRFFLAVGQTFASDAFIKCFLTELIAIGNDYQLLGDEPLCLCDIAPFQSKEN